MNLKELKDHIRSGKLNERLLDIYMDPNRLEDQTERYVSALTRYEDLFGDADAQIISAPGRTEVGGNHTDHQRGQVLAASINDDAIAVASPNDSHQVRIQSEGYGMLTIDLHDLEKKPSEEGTSAALIWGILACASCGIGFFWLIPYMQMTFTNSYAALKNDALASGRLCPADFGSR